MTGIIFLGAPGVGKGTQAAILAEELGIPAISTGAIFRSNIEQGTELGKLAEGYMSRGELVPDSVTNSMVDARLSSDDVQEGFLLDGYPRNLDQAHKLRDMLAEKGLTVDVVIEIDAPEDVLVAHMLKRAGEESRADDTPEVFARRLEEYRLRTAPIASYYSDQDLVVTVDGVGTIEEVAQRVLDGVKQARV